LEKGGVYLSSFIRLRKKEDVNSSLGDGGGSLPYMLNLLYNDIVIIYYGVLMGWRELRGVPEGLLPAIFP